VLLTALGFRPNKEWQAFTGGKRPGGRRSCWGRASNHNVRDGRPSRTHIRRVAAVEYLA